MSYIDYVIKGIVNREGGFVNKKEDKGGPTNHGITIGTLSRWRNTKCTIQDVINLKKEEAIQIYKEFYVREPGFLLFEDEALAEQLIDAGVNHGPTGAKKMLQRALEVTADGAIGPQTLTAFKRLKPFQVFCRFMSERLNFYSRLVDRDRSQLVFAAGWMNRCAEMIRLYCAAVNAPEAVEVKLEAVAKNLNICANAIGKKKNDTRAITWFAQCAIQTKMAERA